MINGTWVMMLDGSRVAAVHLGGGKVEGIAYTVPDPTPEDPFNKKTITAREAKAKLKANLQAIASAGETPPPVDEPAAEEGAE